MIDLAALGPDDFEPLVGDAFHRPLDDGGTVELRLAAVERHRDRPGGRPPFALLFTGPAQPILAPDVHPLDHAGLGRLEVLVGPVAGVGPPSADITHYEVVFG